jgi:hypothetical protein
MKIKSEHYSHLKAEIEKLVKFKSKNAVLAYKESLKTDDRIKDLDKRFRWDLFKAACLVRFTCENLYNYLNDDHIDTALKSIIKELNLN